jgi:hypothetical protein
VRAVKNKGQVKSAGLKSSSDFCLVAADWFDASSFFFFTFSELCDSLTQQLWLFSPLVTLAVTDGNLFSRVLYLVCVTCLLPLNFPSSPGLVPKALQCSLLSRTTSLSHNQQKGRPVFWFRFLLLFITRNGYMTRMMGAVQGMSNLVVAQKTFWMRARTI